MTTQCGSAAGPVLAVLFTSLFFSSFASAQNGDGGAASGNVPGSSANGAQPGSQGPSDSAANISTGATIAIAIVVAIVVVLGVLTAVLFWQAKKRQWTMKETLRHSTRRVTTGLKNLATPLTPHRATFSPIKTRFTPRETKGLKGTSGGSQPLSFSRRNRPEDMARTRDLEKAEPAINLGEVRDARSNSGRGLGGSKPKPMIRIPSRDDGLSEPPKTPMWNRFLGRT